MLADSFVAIGSEGGRSSCPSCAGSRFFNGLIDEVTLYNRALSAAEISAIYAATVGGKCASPTGPFLFVQPTNQVAMLGANVSLVSIAGGTSPLHYQWLFNGLEIAGAGLQHDARLMPIGAHSVDDLRIGSIQIHQNVAGVAVRGERREVNIKSLAVASAQEPYRGPSCQQTRRPQPFSGARPSTLAMNRTDQVQLVWHRRQLPANSRQGNKKSSHHCDCDHKTIDELEKGIIIEW